MRHAQRWEAVFSAVFSNSRVLIVLNKRVHLAPGPFLRGKIAAEAGSDPMAHAKRDYQIALGQPLSKEGKDLVIRF
jgi:hypothetical protein